MRYALFLVAMLALAGCSGELPPKPSYFEVRYSFGVGEKNVLDTAEGLYAKDMVCAGPKEYTMILGNADREKIYSAIVENGFFYLKDDFTERCDEPGCGQIKHESSVTINVTVGSHSKAIRWAAGYIRQDDPELKNLSAVSNTIYRIIERREKEMNISQPDCGYL